jgi:PAS domain S-box-containing protein
MITGTPLYEQINLLIVDDIEANLILLKKILQPLGANLILATSGASALQKVANLDIALALIDVRMSGMNGFELAVKLNEDRSGEKVPIIFITANDHNNEQLIKGYRAGAVDYITKPIYNNIILSKVSIFLDLFNQKQKILKDAAELKKLAEKLASTNRDLRMSEQKYRNYIENAPDGVFIADENGRYVEVNDAACRITGYENSELLKMTIKDILPEESLNKGLAYFKRVVLTGKSTSDLLFVHKNGSVRWLTIDAVKLSDTRFLGFAKDITIRKKAEEELQNSLEQLHRLTKHIEKIREDERVAIARDLHDDLGQALTAVRIDLGIIKHLVSDAEVVLKIMNVSALVGETIKTVQRLTAELRPQIIDDLGLEAAIEWYTKEFAQRNGIEVFIDIDSSIFITPDASLNLFKIMQESLTNIARHSKATQVDIGLNKEDDFIVFWISDNGIGIKENEIKSKNSFGIIGMMERASLLGGTLDFCLDNDRGTLVKLLLPT